MLLSSATWYFSKPIEIHCWCLHRFAFQFRIRIASLKLTTILHTFVFLSVAFSSSANYSHYLNSLWWIYRLNFWSLLPYHYPFACFIGCVVPVCCRQTKNRFCFNRSTKEIQIWCRQKCTYVWAPHKFDKLVKFGECVLFSK